jgi:hypothetical protein
MATERLSLAQIEAQAGREHGPFGDHLRRLSRSLSEDPHLLEALRQALAQGACPTEESFYRLRSAGVLLGDTAADVRPRCGLYRAYLAARLR